MGDERENLTWQGFGEASRELARAAVIYEKPRSVIKCDYVWRRTDQWINFPWSSEPPVVYRAGQVLDA